MKSINIADSLIGRLIGGVYFYLNTTQSSTNLPQNCDLALIAALTLVNITRIVGQLRCDLHGH